MLALKFECAALGLPIPTNPTPLKSLPLHTAPPIQRRVAHAHHTSSEIHPRRIANDLWLNNHVLKLSYGRVEAAHDEHGNITVHMTDGSIVTMDAHGKGIRGRINGHSVRGHTLVIENDAM